MKTPEKLSKTLALLVWAAVSLAAWAEEDPAARGLQIVQEMERRDDGWEKSTADLTMTLLNKQGESSVRKIRIKAYEVMADGDKSLLIFDSPPDVKDTVFLNHAHKLKDDDQWIFLPALKRVKRIASSSKGGSFMGSEFSYEDMSPPVIEKYTYLYLKDGDFQGRPSFVVERTPKDPYSMYSKQVAWIDQENYIPWQIEYYDRAGGLSKTQTFRKYKKHLDHFWRAGESEMTNHQTGKKTLLLLENFTFKSPEVSEGDFGADALEKKQ
jgi:outer membrane lipoprotein-sorting protein